MIDTKEIKTEIVAVLEQARHSVIATEVKEGFTKPAFFVDVFKAGSAVQNRYIKFVSVGVEITYTPVVETHEHLIEIADDMEQLFTNRELEVGDRVLHIDDVSCDIDGNTLSISFELEFHQETGAEMTDADLDTIQELEVRINGLTRNNY